METRKCRYCDNEYPIDNYEIANVIKGKAYRRWKCKKCYLGRKVERVRENRAKFVEYKKTLSCEHCGIKDFRVIEFHHTSNDKEECVANMMGFAFKRIMKEIQKCIPLCANCHRILHFDMKEDVGSSNLSIPTKIDKR